MCLGLATGYRKPTDKKERTYADLKQTHFPENKIDTELTSDDILKAWECCGSTDEDSCLRCPLLEFDNCYQKLCIESSRAFHSQQVEKKGVKQNDTRT